MQYTKPQRSANNIHTRLQLWLCMMPSPETTTTTVHTLSSIVMYEDWMDSSSTKQISIFKHACSHGSCIYWNNQLESKFKPTTWKEQDLWLRDSMSEKKHHELNL